MWTDVFGGHMMSIDAPTFCLRVSCEASHGFGPNVISVHEGLRMRNACCYVEAWDVCLLTVPRGDVRYVLMICYTFTVFLMRH